MALNFPITPADGDTYQGYVYSASEGVWNSDPHQIASRLVTSATAPPSPSEGDGWFDTNTAKSYVFYDGVWVQLGALGTVDLNQIADVAVSSPANGESLVYDGTDWVNQSVDIYDANSSSTGYFSMPKGTNAQRPITPSNGDMRFNTDSGQPEWYSATNDQWVLFKDGPTFDVQYLVIAGGGAGGQDGSGNRGNGGGGAGGYRSNVSGESSGGGASAQSALSLFPGTYTVTVGAGGAGVSSANRIPGNASAFHSVSCTGGGGGGLYLGNAGGAGGSGGGGAEGAPGTGGTGTAGEGFAGGTKFEFSAGGGGGAGEVGETPVSNAQGGTGGDGVASSITGSSVYRAGGGGATVNTTTNGVGGLGGGGDAASSGTGLNDADANTGGGGGAGKSSATRSGNGGSGVVILKYPSLYTATPTVGLSSITSTVGDYKVTQFTAGTGSVTFS